MATAEIVETVESALDDDALYEVIDGKIEEKHVGAYECWVAFRLGYLLEAFAETNRLGRTVVEALFPTKRNVNQKRRPDVAYVSPERWPLDKAAPEGEAFGVVPDLVVEVISPTEPASERQAQIH